MDRDDSKTTVRTLGAVLLLLALSPATGVPASSRSRPGSGPRCRSTARASVLAAARASPARRQRRAGGRIRPWPSTLRRRARSRSTASCQSRSTSATAGRPGRPRGLGRSQLPAEPRLRGHPGAGPRAIGGIGGIELPTLPLEAGGQIDGFWGVNAGLGVRFRLSDAVSANVEGRGFFFGERELDWKIDQFPLSPELGEALRQQLGPIRFTPGFFQATAGSRRFSRSSACYARPFVDTEARA